jgi:hypothetical protein
MEMITLTKRVGTQTLTHKVPKGNYEISKEAYTKDGWIATKEEKKEPIKPEPIKKETAGA